MEMKKKLIFAFVITILLLSVPLFAENGILDAAGLLSGEEKASLEMMMEEIAASYNFDLIILTVDNLDGEDAIDFSWNFLDEIGLDGKTWDGCLLLVSPGDRDYAFTASGRGDKILNKTAYDKLEKDVVSYLKKNDYAGAYETYIRLWEEFLVLESQGRKYNFLREPSKHRGWLGLAWIIALLIGLSVVRSMKKQMNTALPKTQADAYIIPGSLALTQQQDRFLYSTVSKTRRQSSSSSGGRSSRSGGGRSSRSGKY